MSTFMKTVFKYYYLFTGGWDGDNYVDQILEYNVSRDEWTLIGQMKEARNWHGVSIIDFDESDCQ